PIILHEQTQNAGLSSKVISRLASKICVSFEESKKHFPKEKVVFTGNPLRSEIFKINEKISLPEGKVIYVTGGSTGSHKLNTIVEEILGEILKRFVVIHQTGGSTEFNDYERLTAKREELPHELKKRYIVRKFIYPNEIGFVLKSVDLVLTRAGINIVMDLLATEKVGLFVPLSHGQKNEQLENAILIKRLGVGDYMEEKDASPGAVFIKIIEM